MDDTITKVTLIRRWLLQGEKPAYVDAIDSKSEIKHVEWRPGMTWIAWARTLDACAPVRLEAYDHSKQIIRATTMASLNEVDPEDLQDERPTIKGAVRGPLSSNEQMLCTMSELLAKAYETSTVHVVEGFVTTAFNKLAEICDAFAKGNESRDRAIMELERALQRQSDLLTRVSEGAVATEGGSLLEQMIGGYVAGQAQASAGGAGGNGASNGKAKVI